jgi:hypothetical protein
MIGLSGSLSAIGLRALVRFLADLAKTGTLRVSHDRWMGEVAFERGTVVGASFEAERGLAALDAIALALPTGDFVFADAPAEGVPAGARNIDLSREALQDHLDDLLRQRGDDALGRLLPSTVVQLVPERTNEDEARSNRVDLTRGAIQTLLSVDGRR